MRRGRGLWIRTYPRQLHGLYPSWIRKVGAKTITWTLSPAQADRYRPLFDNTKRLRELISELETFSAESSSKPKDGHEHEATAARTAATAKTPL